MPKLEFSDTHIAREWLALEPGDGTHGAEVARLAKLLADVRREVAEEIAKEIDARRSAGTCCRSRQTADAAIARRHGGEPR